mgnify:CR=1 FL=1
MNVQPNQVHEVLSKSMLVDGFDLVLDLKKSKGCKLYDSRHDKYLLDCFSFFASAPLGCNHPKMTTPEFTKKMGELAINNPTNSDIYTVELAEFVDAFRKDATPDYFKYHFFVAGGALGVENALKTAFDWKVRKNIAEGKPEHLGSKVIHFKDAFHGRTGYTLSMTNTFSKDKTKYFPIFDWPRITNPKITFPLEENLQKIEELEAEALDQITASIQQNPDDIAALLIEPIQGEGGDNHFRKEFMQNLRKITLENDIMFAVDEVQSGVGLTGKMWAHEHDEVKPDLLAFGKKTQVCGCMVGPRVDDVEDNVFHVSSRINSTWGGSLIDMVRFQKYLEIIKEENLVQNAEIQGKRLLEGLYDIQERHDMIGNARGKGLMCAFDAPSPEKRNQLQAKLFSNGLAIVTCGAQTIRFRPPLIVGEEEIDEMLSIIDSTLKTF